MNELVERLRSVKWDVISDGDRVPGDPTRECVFVDMRPDDFEALLTEAAAALAQQPSVEKFAGTFRCESNGIVFYKNAPIHSVTMHDDGVIEVVIDHWPQQPLTDEHKAILKECRNQAMWWTLKARIPECGAFGGIAQDLDYLCGQLGLEEQEVSND